MAKSKNQRTAAPVNKQTTEPSTPAPVADPATTTTPEAPTTNPANDPTVVPPVAPETETPEPTAPPADDNQTEDPAPVEVKESMKRAELEAVATEEGLANASKYKDKAVVVAAVERVRAGEAAADVDAELTPVVDNGADTVEVEVSSPFYDVQSKVNRRAGAKFTVSAARAKELRGHKLIK